MAADGTARPVGSTTDPLKRAVTCAAQRPAKINRTPVKPPTTVMDRLFDRIVNPPCDRMSQVYPKAVRSGLGLDWTRHVSAAGGVIVGIGRERQTGKTVLAEACCGFAGNPRQSNANAGRLKIETQRHLHNPRIVDYGADLAERGGVTTQVHAWIGEIYVVDQVICF